MQSHQVDHNPTNAELLSAIQTFANSNEKRLQSIENRVGGIEKTINTLATKEDLKEVKQDVAELQKKADNTTTILDGISKNVSTIQQDHVAAIAWLKRHDKNFAAHDKIIGHNCNFELAVASN